MDNLMIERKIADFLSHNTVHEAVNRLYDALPDGAVIYLVGGAIRNLIIGLCHADSPHIDDIDLFVDGVSGDIDLTQILPDDRFTSTDLGGIRWKPAGSPVDIDICLLKDFIIIKKYHLPPRVESLLDTIDFTMNTVAYDIRKRRLHERNALADIKKRVMAFNTSKLYTKTAIAYRTLLLHHKTGFTLSEDVFVFVKQAIDLDTLMEVKKILHSRLGREKTREILDGYDDICAFGGFDDYRRHVVETMAGKT